VHESPKRLASEAEACNAGIGKKVSSGEAIGLAHYAMSSTEQPFLIYPMERRKSRHRIGIEDVAKVSLQGQT
jgi:hypothetical protein